VEVRFGAERHVMIGVDPAFHPLELELDRSRHLRVTWGDRHESVIPLAVLRKNCPCASCRSLREERERNPLAILSHAGDPAAMCTATSAELVGTYALRIDWADGHNTGIFYFRLLRSLG